LLARRQAVRGSGGDGEKHDREETRRRRRDEDVCAGGRRGDGMRRRPGQRHRGAARHAVDRLRCQVILLNRFKASICSYAAHSSEGWLFRADIRLS
jgi:hypothetical protein